MSPGPAELLHTGLSRPARYNNGAPRTVDGQQVGVRGQTRCVVRRAMCCAANIVLYFARQRHAAIDPLAAVVCVSVGGTLQAIGASGCGHAEAHVLVFVRRLVALDTLRARRACRWRR